MPPPAYQVVILSPIDGSVSAIYDASAIYDLRYARSLNDIGLLAMTLPSTSDIRASFRLDSFIEVYRADRAGVLQHEETYLCRLMHRFIEGDEERFVIGGLSLNHLLKRRIVNPATDGASTDGYSTKTGAADTVIFGYCLEQVAGGAGIGRATPNLTINAVAGIGNIVTARLRFENLFDQVKILSLAGAVDFWIERTTGVSLELSIGVMGSDKTFGTNDPLGLPWVGLSPLRGNLTQPSLLKDRKTEGNYIYALSQGQADTRIVYEVAGTGITDSPLNRMEYSENISNIERGDTQGMATSADASLRDKMVRNEFTYSPTGQEPGNIYHEDWDLGDAVTVDWDETSLDLRIIGIQITINSSGEDISVTVTDDFSFPA